MTEYPYEFTIRKTAEGHLYLTDGGTAFRLAVIGIDGTSPRSATRYDLFSTPIYAPGGIGSEPDGSGIPAWDSEEEWLPIAWGQADGEQYCEAVWRILRAVEQENRGIQQLLRDEAKWEAELQARRAGA